MSDPHDTLSGDPDRADEAPPKRRHTGRWVAVGLLGVVTLLGALYGLAVWRVSGHDVPAGATVEGVPIGGLSTAQAAVKLADELGERASEPIAVSIAGTTSQVDPTQAGLTVDWEATAQSAGSRVWNPATLWARLTDGTQPVDPVISVDQDKLETAAEALATESATEPTEPMIAFTKEDRPKLTPGKDGVTLDTAAATEVLRSAYFTQDSAPIALPVNEIPPTVSAGQAEQVLTSVARPAVSGPVTLRVGQAGEEGTDVEATAEQIARALTFEVANGTLNPKLNAKKLREELADELDPLERPGMNATIVIRDDEPVIVKSKKGLAIKTDELGTKVLAVLPNTKAAKRVAELELTKSQPSFTTADAKALNIKEKLSSFWQWFPPAAYRYQNVGQAAEYINGTILKPGETFSMNDTVHERTPANGYTKGFIISGGRFREELGGGVSIITTAMWTAGFYAGLERVEQHPHGLYISRYQAGLEATVAWDALDLRMRNDTGNGVLITAQRYSNGVRIEMWGTKKWDKVTSSFTNRHSFTGYSTITDDSPTCVSSAGSSGFSIAVTRRRYIDGEAVSTETWPTTYKPTPHVVCTNPNASSA